MYYIECSMLMASQDWTTLFCNYVFQHKWFLLSYANSMTIMVVIYLVVKRTVNYNNVTTGKQCTRTLLVIVNPVKCVLVASSLIDYLVFPCYLRNLIILNHMAQHNVLRWIPLDLSLRQAEIA